MRWLWGMAGVVVVVFVFFAFLLMDDVVDQSDVD